MVCCRLSHYGNGSDILKASGPVVAVQRRRIDTAEKKTVYFSQVIGPVSINRMDEEEKRAGCAMATTSEQSIAQGPRAGKRCLCAP